MKSFLAIFYPLLKLIGLKQAYETIRFIWSAKIDEGKILEARFERFLCEVWNSRWTIIGISAFWLIFSAVTFAVGILGGNPLFISAGGLAITLYVWVAGLAVQTLVATYYRIMKHNRDSLELVPQEFLKWLQLMGLHERPFHRLPMDDGAAARLDTKIQNIYTYLMIVTLSYTFWLGMFPNGKVWVATLVILSGVLLLVLLSQLLGSDIKRPLRALKFLVLCYLLLAIKMALGMGIFPNLADDIRNKFKPQLEKNISSMLMGWVTPSKEEPKPPVNDVISLVVKSTPPPDLNKMLMNAQGGGNTASPSINTDNTTNIINESSGGSISGKKHRGHQPYIDDHLLAVCRDYPDLEKCELVKSVLGAQTPSSTTPMNGTPTTNEIPSAAPPPATSTTGDTITPFGLPPVKQLP